MSDPSREGEDAFRGSEAEGAIAEDADDRPTLPLDQRVSVRPSAAPVPAAIRLVVAGRTDVGLVRDHNEDNYLVADLDAAGAAEADALRDVGDSGCVFAVCDGMGGAAAGEVASGMAVETILAAMREATPSHDRDGFAHALVHAVEQAGARIFEAASDDRSRRGMGTTATVAALMDATLFVGQVGDSRAYVLRDGEFKQLTKDQSLVNQLIEAGQLTEDEAEAFEHSNIILQALGTTDQVSVDLTFLELRRGDRLLLCSDGLSGLVHADVMRDVLMEYDDLGTCCDRLVELARGGGGHDNITVIVAEFDGEGLSEPAEGDLTGYQQYPLPLAGGGEAAPSYSSDDRPSGSFDARGLAHPGEDGRGHDAGGSGRYLMVAFLLLAAAFAVYYWTGDSDRGSPGGQPVPGASTGQPVVAEPREPRPVEVVVRTDVVGGELHVDGASYGPPQGEGWMLDLPPGPHRLEARSGGSVVASTLVTVREGIPATVFLSMPEGTDIAEPEGASESEIPEEAPEAAPLQLSPAEKRRLRRQKSREERRARSLARPPATAVDDALPRGGGMRSKPVPAPGGPVAEPPSSSAGDPAAPPSEPAAP